MKSTQTKPSIVFCHGLWADGSCFSKVIAPLQADGHEVLSAQYSLNTTADAALAPDADETSQTQQSNFPRTDVFSYIEVADGRIWLLPEGIECFAGDLSEQEKKLVWATHFPPAADLFNAKVAGTAWRSKPSWYIVAKKDRTVHPDLERFFAKRMGATTYELESSHVPMLSQPERVIDVIRTAAKGLQGATATA